MQQLFLKDKQEICSEPQIVCGFEQHNNSKWYHAPGLYSKQNYFPGDRFRFLIDNLEFRWEKKMNQLISTFESHSANITGTLSADRNILFHVKWCIQRNRQTERTIEQFLRIETKRVQAMEVLSLGGEQALFWCFYWRRNSKLRK